MALALVWTDKEVRNFIHESNEFFILLSEYPELLQKTSRHKNVYRGPMNKLTVITYLVKPRKKQIELINVRGARQKPLK
jgi:hypothetical protein